MISTIAPSKLVEFGSARISSSSKSSWHKLWKHDNDSKLTASQWKSWCDVQSCSTYPGLGSHTSWPHGILSRHLAVGHVSVKDLTEVVPCCTTIGIGLIWADSRAYHSWMMQIPLIRINCAEFLWGFWVNLLYLRKNSGCNRPTSGGTVAVWDQGRCILTAFYLMQR